MALCYNAVTISCNGYYSTLTSGPPPPAVFLGEPRVVHLFSKRTSAISPTSFYGRDVLPATEPSLSSTEGNKAKALTPASGLASSFVYPPPDCCWKGVAPFTPALRCQHHI